MNFDAAPKGPNENVLDFLNTKWKPASTFLYIGQTTGIAEHRAQIHADALKAYRAVLHLLPRVKPPADQELAFQQEITALKDRLSSLGIQV